MSFLTKRIPEGEDIVTAMSDEDCREAHARFIDMFRGVITDEINNGAEDLIVEYVNRGYSVEDVSGVFGHLYFGCLCMALADFAANSDIHTDEIIDVINTYNNTVVYPDQGESVH